MIKFKFEFPCGGVREIIPASETIKGLRLNNKRPTSVTVYDNGTNAYANLLPTDLEDLIGRVVIPALDPSDSAIIIEENAKYMFNPIFLMKLRGFNGKTNPES